MSPLVTQENCSAPMPLPPELFIPPLPLLPLAPVPIGLLPPLLPPEPLLVPLLSSSSPDLEHALPALRPTTKANATNLFIRSPLGLVIAGRLSNSTRDRRSIRTIERAVGHDLRQLWRVTSTNSASAAAATRPHAAPALLLIAPSSAERLLEVRVVTVLERRVIQRPRLHRRPLGRV